MRAEMSGMWLATGQSILRIAMKATPTAQSGIQTATQKAKARLLSKTVHSMKPRRLLEVLASETEQRPHSSLRNRAKKRLCMLAGPEASCSRARAEHCVHELPGASRRRGRAERRGRELPGASRRRGRAERRELPGSSRRRARAERHVRE
jgi:hypothetical protein